jgi:nicotinamidase-related amidase
VVFTSDCTATFSQREHDATLHTIDQFFGQVVPAEDILDCWRPGTVQVRAAS